MLALGITLLLLAAILYILRRIVGLRLIQNQRGEKLRAEFFELANVLVEDERTPPLLLDVTGFLARVIADKHLTWKALWYLVTGRVNRDYDQVKAHAKPIEDVVDVPPDLLRVWRHLGKAFVLAITFNSFLLGSIVRRLFLWPATTKNGHCNDGNGSDGVGSSRAQAMVRSLVADRFQALAA